MSSFNQRKCVGCGQPCDGFYCYLCTCQQCGIRLINGICLNCTYEDGKPVTCCGCQGLIWGGFCLFCASRAEYSFTYDPNPNSFDDSQNLFDYPSQPSTRRLLVNYVGTMLIMVMIVHLKFRLSTIRTRVPIKTLIISFHKLHQDFHNNTFVYPVIHHPPQETSVEILQARENLMQYIQTFLKKFNHISFRETPKVLSRAWDKYFEIQHAQPEDIQELLRKLLEDFQIIREELAEYINSPSWNSPTFYNDDEYSIQVSESLKKFPIAITPVLPTEEPDNSLSIRDEHLSTISETESDEIIKSSVENLVPIPSESKGIIDNMFCENS
nr:hypothetical protein [Tanacetum cinerariifolium]